MTDLSKDLISKLKENYYIKNIEVANFQESKDGTVKYLFKLNDDKILKVLR